MQTLLSTNIILKPQSWNKSAVFYRFYSDIDIGSNEKYVEL